MSDDKKDPKCQQCGRRTMRLDVGCSQVECPHRRPQPADPLRDGSTESLHDGNYKKIPTNRE